MAFKFNFSTDGENEEVIADHSAHPLVTTTSQSASEKKHPLVEHYWNV